MQSIYEYISLFVVVIAWVAVKFGIIPWVLHWKWIKVMRQSQVKFSFFNGTRVAFIPIFTTIPMLFLGNTILVHTSQFSVQSSAATGLPVPTNVLLCTKHTSTLIVILNFTVIPNLFLVLLPVHYHLISDCVACYALNMCQHWLLYSAKFGGRKLWRIAY